MRRASSLLTAAPLGRHQLGPPARILLAMMAVSTSLETLGQVAGAAMAVRVVVAAIVGGRRAVRSLRAVVMCTGARTGRRGHKVFRDHQACANRQSCIRRTLPQGGMPRLERLENSTHRLAPVLGEARDGRSTHRLRADPGGSPGAISTAARPRRGYCTQEGVPLMSPPAHEREAARQRWSRTGSGARTSASSGIRAAWRWQNEDSRASGGACLAAF